MKKSQKIPVIVFAVLFLSAILVFVAQSGDSPLYSYEIVNTYPHDSNAFTQGLVYENGFLYEGTGRNGYSSIRKVELKTGKVLQIYNLPNEFFGEGITISEDKIVQLTYMSHVGFVYDKETFNLVDGFSYPTEGWGLTHDGKHLIMSDGTSTLYFLDPESFEQKSKLTVYYKGSLLNNINELEYINGKIYANIWQKDQIAVINPGNGYVESVIDLKGLLSVQERRMTDVLNGIAYDKKNKRLFVTGKLWPKLFEIKLVPKEQLQ